MVSLHTSHSSYKESGSNMAKAKKSPTVASEDSSEKSSERRGLEPSATAALDASARIEPAKGKTGRDDPGQSRAGPRRFVAASKRAERESRIHRLASRRWEHVRLGEAPPMEGSQKSRGLFYVSFLSPGPSDFPGAF